MIRINLLKPERKEIRETSMAAPEAQPKGSLINPQLFSLLILAAIVAAVFLFIQQRGKMSEEQNRLDAAKEERKSLLYVETKMEELERQKTLLQTKIDLIIELKRRQGNAVIAMDELSRRLPEWVWLEETNFENNFIRLKGKAMSNNLLADYIYNLTQSEYFNNVNLLSSTQTREGGQGARALEFNLTLRFRKPPRNTGETQPAEKGEGQ